MRFEIYGPNYIWYHVCLDCFGPFWIKKERRRKKEHLSLLELSATPLLKILEVRHILNHIDIVPSQPHRSGNFGDIHHMPAGQTEVHRILPLSTGLKWCPHCVLHDNVKVYRQILHKSYHTKPTHTIKARQNVVELNQTCLWAG